MRKIINTRNIARLMNGKYKVQPGMIPVTGLVIGYALSN